MLTNNTSQSSSNNNVVQTMPAETSPLLPSNIDVLRSPAKSNIVAPSSIRALTAQVHSFETKTASENFSSGNKISERPTTSRIANISLVTHQIGQQRVDLRFLSGNNNAKNCSPILNPVQQVPSPSIPSLSKSSRNANQLFSPPPKKRPFSFSTPMAPSTLSFSPPLPSFRTQSSVSTPVVDSKIISATQEFFHINNNNDPSFNSPMPTIRAHLDRAKGSNKGKTPSTSLRSSPPSLLPTTSPNTTPFSPSSSSSSPSTTTNTASSLLPSSWKDCDIKTIQSVVDLLATNIAIYSREETAIITKEEWLAHKCESRALKSVCDWLAHYGFILMWSRKQPKQRRICLPPYNNIGEIYDVLSEFLKQQRKYNNDNGSTSSDDVAPAAVTTSSLKTKQANKKRASLEEDNNLEGEFSDSAEGGDAYDHLRTSIKSNTRKASRRSPLISASNKRRRELFPEDDRSLVVQLDEEDQAAADILFSLSRDTRGAAVVVM